MLNHEPLKAMERAQETHTHVWRVSGLDCPVCAKEFENAVRAQEGIAEADLDFMAGILKVLCRLEKGCEETIAELGKEHGLVFADVAEPASTPGRSFIPQEAGIMAGSGLFLLVSLMSGLSGFLVPAFLIAGWPVSRRAWGDVQRREITMNVLMLIAAIGAFGIGEWHEGAMVLFLFSVARWLEKLSTERARNAIEVLKEQLPAVAHLVEEDGHEFDLPVRRVTVGKHLRLRANEKIPLDGVVIGGSSHVDESTLTGESAPVIKEVGSQVFAGTMNQDGALTIEVTAESENTRFSRIMHSVEKAQSRKTRFQGSVERFASIYTPMVVLLALLVGVLPPLLLGGGLLKWVYSALVLLVIACPCALVLAAPVTLVSAMSAAARSGILLRGGDILEEAAGIKAVAFDKTGTLTVGEPEILEILPIGSSTKESLFQLAASLEQFSDHPLARPFRLRAVREQVSLSGVVGFSGTRGRGVEGKIDGRSYRLGAVDWALALCPGWQGAVPEISATCVSISLLCDETGALGLITLGDRLRKESPAVVESLRRFGIQELALFSGDRPVVAREFGHILGLGKAFGNLSPEEKATEIGRLMATCGPTLMIGDGINDTPALATATVGVAMGDRGSDAVLETSGAVLIHDDLTRLPLLLQIARRSQSIIRQNIALAIGLKLVVFGLSLAGLATLWMAVLADTGASVLVVMNGLRALLVPSRS